MESDNPLEIHSESPDDIRGCSLYLGSMCMCQATQYGKQISSLLRESVKYAANCATFVLLLLPCVRVCQVVWGLIMLSESIRNNRVLLNMDAQ